MSPKGVPRPSFTKRAEWAGACAAFVYWADEGSLPPNVVAFLGRLARAIENDDWIRFGPVAPQQSNAAQPKE